MKLKLKYIQEAWPCNANPLLLTVHFPNIHSFVNKTGGSLNLGLRKFNCKRVLTCICLHLSTFSLQSLVKVQAPASPIFFFIDSFPLPFVSSCPGCFSDPVLLAPPGWRWLAHLCLPPGLVLLMPLFKDDHPYTMKIFVCIITFMLYPSSIAARFLFYFCPSSYICTVTQLLYTFCVPIIMA